MDLRYGLRVLAKAPGFAAIAILTLALGIGINTVVFTLYSAVAMKPIAARDPGELVRVGGTQNGRDLDPFTWPQYQEIQNGTRSFAGVIATSQPQPIAVRSAAGDEVLRARFVSDNYFDVLGVQAALGRTLSAGDRTAAVVSYKAWQRMGGDRAVLTRTIRTPAAALAIVGVAPERFAGTGMPAEMPDLWIPASAQTLVLSGVDWLRDDRAHEFQLLARRNPRTSLTQATAELDVMGRGWPLVDGKAAHLTVRRATFFQTDSGEFSSFSAVVGVLMVAVGMVLLIGSINLVNLFFARHAAREREFAVRRALGAGRLRLMRQLCTESLLVGVCGGVLGLLFSVWTCSWIGSAITELLARISGGAIGVHLDVTPDWRVFVYTVAVSLITGIAVGLWPALRASSRDVHSGLKQTAGGSTGERRKRNLLMGAQVAACLMLLTAAGLLFRGVWRSGAIDPGFDMAHVAGLALNTNAIAASAPARTALLRESAERVAALPDTAAVAWSQQLPFMGHMFAGFQTEQGASVRCAGNLVSDRFFETMGIPIRAGRNFRQEEVEKPSPVVIVSDLAAARAWPGQDPIGMRIKGVTWLRGALPFDTYTVVGVVKSVRSVYLSKPDEPFLYFPKQPDKGSALLLVRTHGAPEAALHSIIATLGTVNPTLPSQSILFTLTQGPGEIQRMMAETPALVSAGLGALALLLGAVGMFGLASQLVAQRTREIAIRMAIGAERGDVVRLVLAQSMRPVLAGAAVGTAGAMGISALLRSMVAGVEMPDLTFGAGAFDPITYAGALLTLAAAVVLATALPLRRATGIAPAEALRNE
jgi:predicted permease